MKRAGAGLFFLIISVILVISCRGFADSAFSGSPEMTGNIEFGDINGHWAEGDIIRLALKETAFGFSDSTFHPDSPITRLDAATMLVKLFENADSSSRKRLELAVSLPFEDTASLPSEQQRFISEVLKIGLMKGDKGSSTFRPTNPIKRLEAAVIMVRALGLEGEIRRNETASEKDSAVSAGSIELPFSDTAEIPVWAVPYVEKAVELKLINGYNDGTFKPMKSITRGEFAALVSRLDRLILNHKDSGEYFGKVMAVKTQDRKALHVLLANGRMKSFRVKNQVRVFSEKGRMDFEEIAEADDIGFLTDKSGEIVYIRVGDRKQKPLIRRAPGKVLSVSGSFGYLKLRPHYPMEEEYSVRVNLGGDTVVLAGDRIADPSLIVENMEIIAVGTVNEDDEIEAREIEILDPVVIPGDEDEGE